MRHRAKGRQLSRTSSHKKATLNNMATSLFRHGGIQTTEAKAKELRPFAERLITMSKRETLHARRLVLRDIHDTSVVSKMFDTLSSRYAQRPGGYTRIIKLGPRRGDAAEMAFIELVGAELASKSDRAAEAGGEKGGKQKAEGKPKAGKQVKPAKDKDDATKKSARGKGGARQKTESKGKAKGGSAPTVLNAANEVAVREFVAGRLGFCGISALVEATINALERRGEMAEPGSVEEALGVYHIARSVAAQLLPEIAAIA